MPTYEYWCAACEKTIDVFQSMRDAPLTTCPQCETPQRITRQISGGAGIIFKGSGFYETDYKRKAESKPDDAPKSESKSEAKAEAKPAETKTEAKAEPKPAAKPEAKSAT